MSDLVSEDHILARIASHFPNEGPDVLLGRGDDCAVLGVSGPLCVSTDLFMEDVHFRRSYFTPEDIGWKALAVNLSDLTADGARPMGFTVGLSLPPDADMALVDGLCAGMAELAAQASVPLVGGDLSRADKLHLCLTVFGQAEKTQSEFISSVSHELRTPLTAISGWGETLLASGDLEPETKRGMLIILREARRLTGMVEELLEFTRMQDGRFTLNIETADILAEFEDTVFMYGSRLKQEGITLNYDGCDEEIPEIPCDIARMRQVFLNILDNAAKHGGDGKRIDAAISAEDGEVVFRIRDYGPGIPEEELPHVKMKFYKGSSKARGSGIGLAVCEEIVTMHGGTLTLENAEGGGTLVTVRLPMGEESR